MPSASFLEYAFILSQMHGQEKHLPTRFRAVHAPGSAFGSKSSLGRAGPALQKEAPGLQRSNKESPVLCPSLCSARPTDTPATNLSQDPKTTSGGRVSRETSPLPYSTRGKKKHLNQAARRGSQKGKEVAETERTYLTRELLSRFPKSICPRPQGHKCHTSGPVTLCSACLHEKGTCKTEVVRVRGTSVCRGVTVFTARSG